MATLYKAYVSDSSDEESSSDGYTSEESLLNVPGSNAIEVVPSGVKATIPLNPPPEADSGTKFETEESKNTSLFMINSRDRDNRIYPQPTFFTIRLPHVYKNIKTVNIAQINILNSFFNFTAANGNTSFYIMEEGRPSTIISIRQGTYGVDGLVTELSSALNNTPLFAKIDFDTFFAGFQTTGDYSPLFNVPGASVYNSETEAYEFGKTINDIVARYFQQTANVGTISYTSSESYVAYYYPIVKEMTIQYTYLPFSVVGQSIPPGFDSWYNYIVFSFQGLNDPYITPIVLDPGNQAIFDTFRVNNSFEKTLVNAYTCVYNEKQGRLKINAPSLNQSIVNDLNTQYNAILANLVFENSQYKSVNDFYAQYSNSVNLNGTLLGFYNFLQSQFANYFGVNFGQYTLDYYANSNNPVSIYNILNKYGWNKSLTPSVANNVISSVTTTAEQCPILWNNITFLSNASNDTFLSTITIPDSNLDGDYLNFEGFGEEGFGYIDLPFTIWPTSYSKVEFKSRIRQSVNLLTIQRYTDARGPGTDMVYNLNSTFTKSLFSGNNILTDVVDNLSFNLYMVYQNMFHSSEYMRQENGWLQYIFSQILASTPQPPYTPFATYPLNVPPVPFPPDVPITPPFYITPPINDIILTSYRPYLFIQVNADKYLLDPNARFDVTFYAENQRGINLSVPLIISWYKDRAGFMADVTSILNNGVEDPRHYFIQKTYTTDVSSATMDVTVNNNQITYFIIRPVDKNDLSSEALRIFCSLKNTYGDYTNATQLDKLDMPYENLPPLSDQFTPASAVFNYPLTSIYDENIFKLGYDISGVNNNVLDYYIQAGNDIYYDPNNIFNYINGNYIGIRYLMNATTSSAGPPSNISSPSTWSLYFDSNSSNSIRDLLLRSTYTNTNKPLQSGLQNEFIMVNWFHPGDQGNNVEPVERFNRPIDISNELTFLPCINLIQSLKTDMVVDNYPDTTGLTGIGFFLPPNQYLTMNSIVLKFAYIQPSSDSNDTNFNRQNSPPLSVPDATMNMLYQSRSVYPKTSLSASNDWDDWYATNRRNTKIGIFQASQVNNLNIGSIQYANAICTLTLEKVTQVNNYRNIGGTLKTREPEWGTYYTYNFDSNSNALWDVTTSPNSWFSTITFPDFAPSVNIGYDTYSNTFLTKHLDNYTFLPRSIGLATSINFPYTTLSNDLQNSYVAIPFYKDPADNAWKVGNFMGLTYTKVPCLPTSNLCGEAPYYGPMGGYGWSNVGDLLTTTTDNFFYWNSKMLFHNLELVYDPATDLTAFGGSNGIKTEYQDTFLFAYNTVGKSLNDVFDQDAFDPTIGYWKWGQESNANYSAFDDQSGYNFLSYIHDYQIQPNETNVANIRAYDPIPKFNTGLRIIGKNATDFGIPTFTQIIQEISSLVHPPITNVSYVPITDTKAASLINGFYKTPQDISSYTKIISTNNYAREQLRISNDYADALMNFNISFSTVGTQSFGKTLYFRGANFTFTSYEDAESQFVNLYNSVVPAYIQSVDILAEANRQLYEYANQRYAGILPQYALSRNRITDPLPFQFLFSTYVNPIYANQYDAWGLGYNLGFNKVDTYPPRTTINADTFIRIVQDYIYLRINPELNMNKLAVSNKENLSETHEPSAEDSKYFCKIILNNFGSYCRAGVILPKNFTPVLSKLDTISFQLVNKDGIQIDNVDCEFDLVLEVTEVQYTQKDNSSMIKPK